MSPDGTQLGYNRFIEGWGYVEVVPANGGEPRRLTTEAADVYHNSVQWSPDGTRLAVSSYDYGHDTYDLLSVTWPEGAWRPLTETPDQSEFPRVWTPDGQELVYTGSRLVSRLMAVSVAELLDGAAAR